MKNRELKQICHFSFKIGGIKIDFESIGAVVRKRKTDFTEIVSLLPKYSLAIKKVKN